MIAADRKAAGLRGLRPALQSLAIREHLPDCGDIPWADLGQFLELTHATRALGAGEMAFAGMSTHYLTSGSDFEALGGAAMRFQFFLWLR